MRYVSINSVPNLSTGTVMRQVTEERRALGDECWIMWGRGRAAANDHEYNFGNKFGFLLDILQTRLDGRAGFHSESATLRLLHKLDEIEPDVVHLHNLHGYYLNVEMLFQWLEKHENVEVKWTLHDCWAFTGHCAHFKQVNCMQWKVGCARMSNCPQLNTYPKTISKNSCQWNYEHKKACFSRLPAERMTIITPSCWLERLVKQSFLAKYPVEVCYNTIDASVFKPVVSDFREQYDIGERFMVLGVASTWTESKGLTTFKRLAELLEKDAFAIVLVGLTKRQIRKAPSNIVCFERTNTMEELARIYSAADLFLHPGVEETYGLTVAEAQACGTHVMVMEGSACVEAASNRALVTVVPADVIQIAERIKLLARSSNIRTREHFRMWNKEGSEVD